MRTTTVRAVALLLVTALVATALMALAGCSAGDGTDHDEADVQFASQMIPHHAQALQMADMTLGQDVSPGLSRLADRIRAAQQPEIDEMSGWLEKWGEEVPRTGYGTGEEHTHDEGMHGMSEGHEEMPGMMSGADLEALGRARGDAFERRWLQMMIAHHEGAVEMAETELDRGENAQATALAERVVSAQRAEIKVMKVMLAQAEDAG